MNLFFSKLGNYGRLGNQLFQIAGVLGFAKHYGAAISFPHWHYEQYFVNPIPHHSDVSYYHQVKETVYNFHDWQLTGDTDILGYLQTEKYFDSIKDEVREQFKFTPELIQKVKDNLPAGLFDKPTILMQVRRTDYVNSEHYYNCPATYYIQALIEHFPGWENHNLLFISDDLAYCKIHFECLPNAYFIDVVDIEQLVVAQMCDHYIIANSSFGWWGAWLGEKENTKVVHCGRLHAGNLLARTNETDYYPERWINFRKDEYKLDLRDCTFTIPVFYDHNDRKENLELSVCMLQKNFNCKIIVGEQGGTQFNYFNRWCTYMKFEGMNEFHRTRMLNDMAVAAETLYIANWDCDVIIPPMQIYVTMQKLRSGADMVFPYDGRFVRLQRSPWFKEIERLLDIGAVGEIEPKGRRKKPAPESSVGGAVFFNKESFIEGGMENEYMISYGPEDAERNDRFKKLGFKVERVGADENGNCRDGLGGCLYHIAHYVGLNSSAKNPHFKQNFRELEKIRKGTRDDLRMLVDTWPWRHKYTERYYRSISEGAIKSAKEVYKALEDIGIKPTSVIDVGCGVGEWNNGHELYYGIDFNIPKQNLIIPESHYFNVDLEKEFYKNGDYKFDLCLCLEVAEHISESRADALIEMLCNLSNRVLFSAAIPYQGGTGHVNEQWQSWWAEKFNEHGFCAAYQQPDIRHNANIDLYYRQNMVLYVKAEDRSDHCRMVWDFVHPKYYEEIVRHLKGEAAA